MSSMMSNSFAMHTSVPASRVLVPLHFYASGFVFTKASVSNFELKRCCVMLALGRPQAVSMIATYSSRFLPLVVKPAPVLTNLSSPASYDLASPRSWRGSQGLVPVQPRLGGRFKRHFVSRSALFVLQARSANPMAAWACSTAFCNWSMDLFARPRMATSAG